MSISRRQEQAEKESDRNSQEEDSVQQDDRAEEVKSRSRKNIAARILQKYSAQLPYKIRTFCATIKSNVERIRELGKHMKRIGEGIWSRLQQAAGIPEKIQQFVEILWRTII